MAPRTSASRCARRKSGRSLGTRVSFLLQPLPSSDAACRAWLQYAACPASPCALESPRRAFLAPRTVAASRSRGSSTARSCRLPSCRSRAHPLRHSHAEDPVGLSRLGRRLVVRISSGAMTPCFDSVLLHARVGSFAWCDDSTRLPRAVRVERGPRELGRLRLAAARAVLTALTAVPPAWVRRGVDPGRFRPMCATHDSFFKVGCPMSRLTPPRSHAWWDARIHAGTSLRRARIHVRAFLPGRLLRSVPLIPRRHSMRTSLPDGFAA